MNEKVYERQLKNKIRKMFPGCHIMKPDAADVQGVPDILILYNGTWAMLEVKKSAEADLRPNQEHYVQHFDEMSYAAFIYPENEEDVLRDLQQTFRSRGTSRLP